MDVLVSINVNFHDHGHEIILMSKKIFRIDEWNLIRKYINDHQEEDFILYNHFYDTSNYLPAGILNDTTITVINNQNEIEKFKKMNYEDNEYSTINMVNDDDDDPIYFNDILSVISVILPIKNANADVIEICTALYDGDIETVNNLLESYSDNDEIWTSSLYSGLIGYTLKIAKSNKLELIKTLVNHGINLETKNIQSSTPILQVNSPDEVSIVKFLIEAGADLNVQGKFYGMNNLLDIWYHNEEIFNMLLDRNINLNMLLRESKHILNYAIGDVINEIGRGITLFKRLVEKGADVNGNGYRSPLVSSIIKNDSEIMNYLLECGVDYHKNNVLYWCIAYGRIEMLDFFLKKGVKEVPIQYTLVEEASMRGYINSVGCIDCLIANGIDIKATAKNSLLYALQCRNYNVFPYLIDKGLQEDHEKVSKGEARSLLAIECGRNTPNFNIIKLLVKLNSNPFSNYVSENPIARLSAVEICIYISGHNLNTNHLKILKYILKKKSTLKLRTNTLKKLRLSTFQNILQLHIMPYSTTEIIPY